MTARPAMIELGDRTAGPTVAVLSGVHGDEPEGVLASGAILELLKDSALNGAVRVLQVANSAAFEEFRRVASDDETNLARVFPGDPAGGRTARIAHAVTAEFIAGTDLLIDLHSAGTDYEMPVFTGFDGAAATAAAAERAAVAFGAPIIWRHPGIAQGRSISAATDLGVPAIYVEGSGGARVRGRDLDRYISGVMNVLADLEIVRSAPGHRTAARIVTEGDGNVDLMIPCRADGVCVTWVDAGDVVDAGCVVAEIFDRLGHRLETIRADRRSIVMMIRRTARVCAGDGIILLAAVEDA